jgi:hypothetical protein
MSAFNAGGGELTATNKVAALMELGFKLVKAEDAYNASSPQFPLNTAAMAVTTTNGSLTLTATLPVEDIRSGGVVGLKARNIFAGTTFGDFNPGTAGDLASTDLPSAFFEMVMFVDDEEKKVRANVVQSQPKMVTHNIDLNTRIANVTAVLPIQTALTGTDGDIALKAIDVLP